MSVLRSNIFPKHFRLRNAEQFQKVYERGVKQTSPTLTVFAVPNGLKCSRFGITTPKKLGKAHDRNRLKRKIREILRTSLTAIPQGYDFVINPRRSANERGFEELSRELVDLLGTDR